MTKTLLQWILLVYFCGIVASEGQPKSLRVVHKLVGGHLSLNRDDDIELMASSAGDGKGSKKKTSNSEEKKTLAQQVADGKYALIQTELFSKPIKKPGVISYRENSEVPHDTINNLGGLNKSDIWLSENHLLVIKGGAYPPHTAQNLDTEVWPAIDDYNAPGRQVKIPAHPKVPPPFPVQLTDNGPLLLLGTNASKTFNGTFPSAIRPLYPEENYVSGGEPPGYAYRHPSNASSGETPFPIAPYPPSRLDIYDPYKEGPLNGSVPFFPFLGPENLPPLDNVTYDEDDPSIYYPPPYSFYYKQDNSTQVPPGPLVPGIVLPPPPNFFAPLGDDVINKTKVDEMPTTTYKPPSTYEPKPIYKLQTTPESATESTTSKTTMQTTTQFSSGLPTLIQNITIPKTTTPSPRRPPTVSNFRKKYPTITILKAITTTIPRVNKEGGRSFKIHQLPQAKTKTVITTTRVPLKNYYTSTHIEQRPNSEVNKQYINDIVVNIPKETTSHKPAAQYYFYEENAISTTPRTAKPPQRDYNVPEYFVPAREVDVVIKEQPPPQQNVRYYFVNNNLPPEIPVRPRKPNTFSIHIARLRDQIHTYETALRNNDYYQRPAYRPIPKPVYQYSFDTTGYQNQRDRYYQPEYAPVENPNRHYNVEIQEAIEVTTPRPVYETTQENNYYYSQSVTENPRKYNEEGRRRKSKPISEYSFEATPNPIFQQLYTKHDEPYIDDVTKEYFTVFGKKLPAATTPIPAYSRAKYIDARPQSQVENKPISLESDTFVNYVRPNQPINPNAEYIDDVRYSNDRIQNRQYGDYSSNVRNLDQDKPYVSYKLPGDEGTHFYFITPQLAQKREQNASYFYSS